MKSTAVHAILVSVFAVHGAPFVQAAELITAQAADRSLPSSIFALPSLPPGTGTPGPGRGDGGGRTPMSCKQVDKPLTALVPAYRQGQAETDWGITVAAQPTVWFYVPYASPSAFGEMVLENLVTQQQTMHTLSLPTQPGIVQVAVANTGTPLPVGIYRWYFSIHCQQNRDEEDSALSGNITRQALSPALQQQIAQATPAQKIAVFGRNGIWHDALTAAAALHCTKPNDSAWTQLLQAIDLKALVQEPIATCSAPSSRFKPPS